LNRIDSHLSSLLRVRLETAREIERLKRDNRLPIVRLDKEKDRLDQAQQLAVQHGLNPDFVRSVIYSLINEAFKIQFQQFQAAPPSTSGLSFDQLRENLLELTEEVADSFDFHFDEHKFATRDYLRYETTIINEVVDSLNDRSLALDLGCATGRQALHFCEEFDFVEVWGCDVSESMIRVAREKAARAACHHRVKFETRDLDSGICQPDASADLVVMTMGTGSEVRNLSKTLDEIARVLKPQGKAVLSFYNSHALAYRWDFIPWPLSLAAEMNTHLNCLDVHTANKTYQIFAHPHTEDEIRRMLPAGLSIEYTRTYPTISSILPDDIFEADNVAETIQEIDGELSSHNNGNYLIVVCAKAESA